MSFLRLAARATRSPLRSRAFTTPAAAAVPRVGARQLTLVGAGGLAVAAGLVWGVSLSQRQPIYADAPPDPSTRLDPSTSLPFPLTLTPSPSLPALSLLGLGVRTVSFLGVRVYVAGFYADPAALKGLDPSFTKSHLLAPSSPDSSASPQGEALMRNLVASPHTFAVRIVPTRSTDFAHLRDGFVRALMGRIRLAGASLPEDKGKRLNEDLQTLKSFFPSQSVPKGHELLLVKTPRGELSVVYDGKPLGTLASPFIANELLLAYFADKNVISPKAKESVAEGLEEWVKRRGQ